MNKKKTILISAIVLLVGGVVTTLIFLTEPTATRVTATKETAMLVDVKEVRQGAYQPIIVATGTVQPAKEIILRPRVGGMIVQLSSSFTPGGYVKKGQKLLQIEAADYRNELKLRNSELEQAQADLNIEMGRQDVAEKDYQLLDKNLTDENKDLVLRKPQLNAVRSRVQAAQAAVDQARLNLQRTSIEAPFNAHIISRNVNVGSQIAQGDNLAQLVGVDVYWIEVTVPVRKLQRLQFPAPNQEGAEVIIRHRTAWADGVHRTGKLFKLVGSLDEDTRLARVIVAVKDPLNHFTNDPESPELILGEFVEVSIMAEKINNVFQVNRDYIRENETIWVKSGDSLDIREVDIVFNDAKYAYVSEGLNDQDQVVTTNLSTVTEGAKLRVEEANNVTSQEDSLSRKSDKQKMSAESRGGSL